MSLTTEVRLSVTGKLVSALDLGVLSFPFALAVSHSLATGVGADQADKVFADQRTLALSATEDLDLAASLVDAFGAAITFVKVKAIVIRAAAGNTNDVHVIRPAANGLPLFLAASDGIAIKPGGAFVWTAPALAGLAVTAGTGDLLTITNGGAGTPVTYDVVIIGTSA